MCAGILVFEATDTALALMAYALGAGISATLVAVRKAYGGSYSTLLAMQKVAEVTPPQSAQRPRTHLSQVLPAVLIATLGEGVTMYVHIGLCIVALFVFGTVRRREVASLRGQMLSVPEQYTF